MLLNEPSDFFSQAIELDPSNHVLYSNRSGAYASLKDFDKALVDASKVTEIRPEWSKGWSRKGAAFHGQDMLTEAAEAYDVALKLEPSNAQAEAGLKSVQKATEAAMGSGGINDIGGDGGLGGMFNDPQLFQKLANNPKTSKFLADPTFMASLQRIRQNPQDMQSAFGDPRMLQVMSVLLGVDMSFGEPGSNDTERFGSKNISDPDIELPSTRDAPPSTSKPFQPTEPAPEPENEEDEESLNQRKAKADAEEEKRLGTASYKKRDFDAAISHYEKAWELHKDVTYLTNLGAAKFENKDYQGCIAACTKAVEEGREVLADFKLIAKAFGRIGSAYERIGDLANAIEYYNKSLTEHRTPDILAKKNAVEKAKIKADKEAYINPAQAEEARELGNQKFKAADWPAAVDAYTAMIKRAPEDPRGYTNRAATLIKLMTFPGAVSDCDQAIKLDPSFSRAYIRKAQALFAMKDYSRCLDVCTEAHMHDKDGANSREIDQQQQKALEMMYTSREGETEEQTMGRIQKDPEIMSILQDPVMQNILNQAKGNPAALNEHMKNPAVRTNIQKLIAAGVIRTR